MSADAPEPLIFVAWYRELTRQIYQDELGALFPDLWKMRPLFINNVLANVNGQGRWCDNMGTNTRETCAEILPAALTAALETLSADHGVHIAEWRWGAAHTALSEHRPFGKHPWLSKLFDLEIPSPGGRYTVNVGVHRIRSKAPYRNTHSVSLRAIYDMANLDNSVFMHSTGQSGNRLSPFYDNFTDPWLRGEYLPMTTDRAQYVDGALGTLVLVPEVARLDLAQR